MIFIVTGHCDMVAGQQSLGLERRGLGPCWGSGSWPSSWFHRSGGSVGGFGAIDRVVVVVDCSCVIVARGDDGLVGVLLLAAICIVVSAVGVQVAICVYSSMEVVVTGLVWVLKLVVL